MRNEQPYLYRDSACGYYESVPDGKLLVCVSPSTTSTDVVRRGAEIARAFGVEWIAVHVQTASTDSATEVNRARAAEHLKLARQLGAAIEIVSGSNVAGTIVDYALRRQVTKIVIGKKASAGLRRIFRPGVDTQLVRRSGLIDVYVVQGAESSVSHLRRKPALRRQSLQSLLSVAAIAAATGICSMFSAGVVSSANDVMIYLAAAFSMSIFFGWLQGIITSVLAVLAFNFFFIRPYHTFNVDDPQYLLTLAVMLAVTLVSSSIAARIRLQTVLSSVRERRTRALYDLSRRLTEASNETQIHDIASRELSTLIRGSAYIVAPGDKTDAADELGRVKRLPLVGKTADFGELLLKPLVPDENDIIDDELLLDGMRSLIVLALDREHESVVAGARLLEVEQEKTRNALLRSISHDLRTPLATISGAAMMLLREGLAPDMTRNLLAAITEETQWMSRIVENMLRATRLEAGALQLSIELETVDDLVTSAVEQIMRQSSDGIRGSAEPAISVTLPQSLLVVPMDLPLMQQVLINILDNAVRYSPPGTPIFVTATSAAQKIEILIEDEGPGIANTDLPHIFEKFYRGQGSRSTRGSGLGLWISAMIVRAHGGELTAENRDKLGTRFRIALPGAAP